MALEIIILAAGQGKRMRSSRAKVLHPLAHTPLIGHVLNASAKLQPERIHIVIGHAGEQIQAYVEQTYPQLPIHWAQQTQQLGTGHAVTQVLAHLPADAQVLVLYADVPLVNPQTLKALLAETARASLAVLTLELDNPQGYGRILRNTQGQVCAIVEEKDASATQKAIQEINTGIMATDSQTLKTWLPKISNQNAQQEYYLTDLIALVAQAGMDVASYCAQDALEVTGVNTKAQLAQLERAYQRCQAHALLEQGVTLYDPERLDIRGHLECGQDVTLDVNCIFEGRVRLGNRVTIEAHCILKDVTLGDDVHIRAYSHLEGVDLQGHNQVGPYARLRPGTQLATGAKVGNFVETKKAYLGPNTKANHLSYLGDAHIEAEVNIGAGTITCNYDGVNKSQTYIHQGAFIGSNTALVAPVTIGAQAVVGAGSTVSKNVSAGALAVSRARQSEYQHWPRPQKKQQQES
ncbi:bifunctional UDP-N-acetylglucosamine pyrophosphorylase / Glucosamine-1-phosphate N-acetyltransferase [Allopseudospirillum japonicum]|uniref:Bifunctional protein GlmU n=1 Tax=Allopseudospirillum japonicum TaxID=64971 RepID=A0A1H6RKT6_9GAMM|nr:bifunctional UDP-N-acetylglucosamine diphosphorylase/glucosamine-1-phosphate N-acetyltransferase GlmU [Allopseudospirillum japonicum]SEI52420.1 bifunctional UDP-N-acetylglucosamine pyrophosphorylase / Glucosamine-1-phosphate N-acetyltransferase [Allopseudospirillum japonicum]